MRCNIFTMTADVFVAVRQIVDIAARMVARNCGASQHPLHYQPGPSRMLGGRETTGKSLLKSLVLTQLSWCSLQRV